MLRILLIALVILFTGFIFSQSLVEGDASTEVSQGAELAVNGVLAKLGLALRLSEHLLRKMAHFAEYAALGILLMLTLRLFVQRVRERLAWPLLLGLMVAVVDETIQAYVPGRSSQVTDVILDFSGVAAGLALGWVVFLVVRRIWRAVTQRRLNKEQVTAAQKD